MRRFRKQRPLAGWRDGGGNLLARQPTREVIVGLYHEHPPITTCYGVFSYQHNATTRLWLTLLLTSEFSCIPNPNEIVMMEISIRDLSFIPAYISAFISVDYVLAKNLIIVNKVLATLFHHCHQSPPTATIRLWRIPDVAMIPICLIWTASISSIVRNLKVDGVYSSLMLVALLSTMGLGWTFDLPGDLVIFGLLPLLLVTALLATRVAQNMGGQEEMQEEEKIPLIEKS